ncbi:MAG: hypothetical protein ACLR7Z_03965 [Bilophila wadsworthia]
MAPAWLADLARYAKLPKDSLSLSFMQLRPESRPLHRKTALFPAMDPTGRCPYPVESFPVPGMDTPAILYGRRVRHYPRSRGHPPGRLSPAAVPRLHVRIAKTGAVELLWQPEQKPQR